LATNEDYEMIAEMFLKKVKLEHIMVWLWQSIWLKRKKN